MAAGTPFALTRLWRIRRSAFHANAASIDKSNLEERSDQWLLNNYNVERPGRIGAELLSRANNQGFLLFKRDKTLDVPATAVYLAALAKNKPVDNRPTVDGRPFTPLKPGDPLTVEYAKENCLFLGTALLEPGFICSRTRFPWKGEDDKAQEALDELQSFLKLAVQTGELQVHDSTEIARGVVRDVKEAGENALVEFQDRYRRSAELWERTPKNKRPSLELNLTRPFVPADVTPEAPTPATPSASSATRLSKSLTRNDILVVHQTAIMLGLARSRTALLSGIHPSITAGLPIESDQAAQLLSDISRLAEIEHGKYLITWLTNASALMGSRREASVFSGLFAPATRELQLKCGFNGQCMAAFNRAFVDAFRSRRETAMFARLHLDKSLDEMASENTTLPEAVHQMCEYMQAHGSANQLVRAAIKANPGNAELKAFVANWCQ